MNIGDKIIINKNIGIIKKKQDNYILIKFNFGQFVYNANSIKKSEIL